MIDPVIHSAHPSMPNRFRRSLSIIWARMALRCVCVCVREHACVRARVCLEHDVREDATTCTLACVCVRVCNVCVDAHAC